jgi:hypothetical protein
MRGYLDGDGRWWCALAAVAAAGAACVPSALAAKPAPGSTWAPGYEISYVETVRDASGAIVSHTERSGLKAGQVFGTATLAGSALGSATSIDTGSDLTAAAHAAAAGLAPTQRRLAGCCSSGGSDTVQFTVTKYTLLGNVAWRYYQVDHWCWQYPNITCLSIGSGFTNVDGQQSVNYGDHGYGWYYTWAGGSSGGHYAHRDGSVSNCIFKWGCISTSYPYVDMWLNGNGAWSASGGGN